MNLKIAYYLGKVDPSSGGVYSYTIALLDLLLRFDEISEIHLFFLGSGHNPKTMGFPLNPKIKFHEIIDNRQFTFKENISIMCYVASLFAGDKGPYRALKRMFRFFNPYKDIETIIRKEKICLFHVPFQVSPIYNLSVPLITTMHDVQEMHFPDYFDSKERLRRAVYYKQALEESNHIIVSFNHIKDDLIRFYNVPPEKISVAVIPLTGSYFDTKDNAGMKMGALLAEYNLPGHFILYPAITWKHKNHLKLLKAISILSQQGDRFFLVCTGAQTDYLKILEAEIEELGLTKQVFFLGLVPKDHLVALYKHADLIVIPSLYEAGSGPLLEAMHYHRPVICARTTTLPEHIGDSNFVFDPNNSEEMAGLIKKGMTDQVFRSVNIENAIRRNAYFEKVNYADQFLDVYKKILPQQK
jgi:glycosyltransferase involved in cell wall biosynthesis